MQFFAKFLFSEKEKPLCYTALNPMIFSKGKFHGYVAFTVFDTFNVLLDTLRIIDTLDTCCAPSSENRTFEA